MAFSGRELTCVVRLPPWRIDGAAAVSVRNMKSRPWRLLFCILEKAIRSGSWPCTLPCSRAVWVQDLGKSPEFSVTFFASMLTFFRFFSVHQTFPNRSMDCILNVCDRKQCACRGALNARNRRLQAMSNLVGHTAAPKRTPLAQTRAPSWCLQETGLLCAIVV